MERLILKLNWVKRPNEQSSFKARNTGIGDLRRANVWLSTDELDCSERYRWSGGPKSRRYLPTDEAAASP